MKADIKINQIKPDFAGDSYINIDDMGMGGVKIWTHVGISPTYIARQGNFLFLFQFGNQEWADEWLEESKDKYDSIKEIK